VDFKAKRQELLALWDRMFRLCDALVTAAEKGEQELKASMVKELNGFLKLSKDILDHAEQQAEQDKLRSVFYQDTALDVPGEGQELLEDVEIQDQYDYQTGDVQARRLDS